MNKVRCRWQAAHSVPRAADTAGDKPGDKPGEKPGEKRR